MAEAKRVASIVAALAAFVLLSSFLGLGGRWMLFAPGAALGFMGSIWSASVWADVVFVATSCAAAVLAFRASRDSILMGALLAALLDWIAYVLSFLSLPTDATSSLGAKSVMEAIEFVGVWGVLGLAFCALAVPVAARVSRPPPAVPPPTAPQPTAQGPPEPRA